MISVIIPARKEEYLKKTVQDVLTKSKTNIEVIVVLDGYWPKSDEVVHSPKVKYLHRGESHGMRNAINSAVAISKGEFIFKLDAHCMLDEGYDVELINNHKDNIVQIPTRKRLEPESWSLIEDGRRDINYMKLNKEYRGRIDNIKNDDVSLDLLKLDKIDAFQGSCYFISKEFYNKIGLLDENFGGSGHEAQEITFKVLENGGVVIRNKNTWYAHWHKTKATFKMDRSQSRTYFKKLLEERKWKDLISLQ